MKSFFKNALASCLGTLAAIAALLIIAVLVFRSYTSKDRPNQKGILHIPISGLVSDFANSGFDIGNLDFSMPSYNLWDLRTRINAASTDEKISALFLEFESAKISQQMVSELAPILENFKSSGKKIYAYSSYFDQNAYLLSTYSDSIFLNPNGGVALKGYGVYSPFFNNLLTRFDININIFFAGKYKSSTEPYRLNEFSADNEFQLRAYLDHLQENLLTIVAKNRGISVLKGREILASHNIYDSHSMKANGIIDQVLYRDEVMDFLRDSSDGKDLVSFASYSVGKDKSKGELALVFASGEIAWSESGTNSITHDRYSKIFKEIRENDNIKSVLLRIDSPGGNGYTSDLIHREMLLLKQAGKKVYTSMGSYATSGAYYIAAASDSIYATSSTMTGSIGVYIMLPSVNQFLKNQLDINVDTIQTNDNAIAYTPLVGLTSSQEEVLKDQTEKLYEVFKEKVSQGRSLSIEKVEELAQGRIWSGKDALKVSLVDDLKSLDFLIEKLSKGRGVSVYPEQNISLQQRFLKEGLDKLAITRKHEIKFLKTKVLEFQKLIEQPSPNMRIPYDVFVTNQ